MSITQGHPVYAGFWVRIGSIWIDFAVIGLLSESINLAILMLLQPFLSTDHIFYLYLFVLFPSGLIMTYNYYSFFNANGRQSLGKKIFDLKVVNIINNPLTIRQSFGRSLLCLDSLLGIGYIVLLFIQRKQTIHDLITRSFVIRTNSKSQHKILYFILVIFGSSLLSYPVSEYMKTHHLKAYRIPTGAMEPTLLFNDFILVDMYRYKHHQAEMGDLIVFKYPENTTLDYIKRCVGMPGDTIEVKNGELYVNHKIEGMKEYIGKNWKAAGIHDSDGDSISSYRITLDNGVQYFVQYYDEIRYRPVYGPKVIPQKGKTVPLDLNNVQEYSNLISNYEGHDLEINQGMIIIDGVPANSYTFEMDYYFMMGDNRDNSYDSRYWGYVLENYIVGKAGIIYYSWEKRIPLYNLFHKVRWSRLGKILH